MRTVTAPWLLIGRKALLASPTLGLLGFAAWVAWSRSTEGRLCKRLVDDELNHYRKERA